MTATANTERLRTKPFRVPSRRVRDHRHNTSNEKTHKKQHTYATRRRRPRWNSQQQIRRRSTPAVTNRPGDDTPTTKKTDTTQTKIRTLQKQRKHTRTRPAPEPTQIWTKTRKKRKGKTGHDGAVARHNTSRDQQRRRQQTTPI